MKRLAPLAEHPFELVLGFVALLSGVALTAGAGPPASINATLPHLVVLAWGAIQVLAGVLIIAGIVIRYLRPALLIVGFRLERAGLWPLAAAATVYGVAGLGYAGLPALYPVGTLLAVAAACAARAAAVSRLERTIRKHQGDPT